jgi:hypothetical protein
MCADVVSVHARIGVGRQAADTFARVVKKVVARGPGIAVRLLVVLPELVVGMLIASRRVSDAEAAPAKMTVPLGE